MRLQPITSSRIDRLIGEPSQVFNLVNSLGSPLNVVFPEQIQKNVNDFAKVYDRHLISGTILFAHKTNQSNALVRQIAESYAA